MGYIHIYHKIHWQKEEKKPTHTINNSSWITSAHLWQLHLKKKKKKLPPQTHEICCDVKQVHSHTPKHTLNFRRNAFLEV